MTLKKRWVQKASERGQGFMELAVSLVFLLILFSAVVDLGWAFYTLTSLRDVSQEAASYGAMCADMDEVKEHLRKSAGSPIDMNLLTDDAIDVCFMASGTIDCIEEDDLADTARGDLVKITIRYEHKIVTPFVGAFIGNAQSYPLTVDVTDTVLAPKVCP